METMDSRPAMRETRCCDERRRGRGAIDCRDSVGLVLELGSLSGVVV